MLLNNLSFREKEIFLNLANAIIKADNVIMDSEQEYFDYYKMEMGLKDVEFRLTDDIKPLLEEVSKNSIKETQRAMFIELITLAYCDNNIAKEEEELLEEISKTFGITEQEKNEVIKLQKDYMDAYNAIVKFVKQEE